MRGGIARSGEVEQGIVDANAARDALRAGKNAGSLRLAGIDLLICDIADARGDAANTRVARNEALNMFRRVLGETHPRAGG